MNSLTSAPGLSKLPVGVSIRGDAALSGRVQRSGTGPFVVRGELEFRGLELHAGTGVVASGIAGRIPLGLAVSAGEGGARIADLPQSGEARGGGRLPELLSDRLARISAQDSGNGLYVERIELSRIAIEQISAQPALRGGRLTLDGIEAKFLDGTLSGQVVADYEEKLNVVFGLAARRLDFRKVIPPERLPSSARDDPRPYYVNADFNATLSYPPAGLEGELQVTRLGREVLFAVLDWIDPGQENASVTNLRGKMEDYLFLVPKSTSLRVQHGSGDLVVNLQRAKLEAGDFVKLKGWAQGFSSLGYLFLGNQTTFPISNMPIGSILGRIAKR